MKARIINNNNPYYANSIKENQTITLYYYNIFFNYYMN